MLHWLYWLYWLVFTLSRLYALAWIVLDCGDLERGFARIRCDHCGHDPVEAAQNLVRQCWISPEPD
ncbi:MAG: hypothetical protein ABSH34_29935 [Verrucomicrobiota bacterium]|jgi:hypothetical protein